MWQIPLVNLWWLIAGSLMTPCKVPIMDCHVLLKKCIQPLPYHLSNMWNQIRSFQSIFGCLGLILVKNGQVQHVWQPLLSVPNGPIGCPLAQNVQNSILGGICYENLADERKKCQKINSWKFKNFRSHFEGVWITCAGELRAPRRAPNIQFSYFVIKMAFWN